MIPSNNHKSRYEILQLYRLQKKPEGERENIPKILTQGGGGSTLHIETPNERKIYYLLISTRSHLRKIPKISPPITYLNKTKDIIHGLRSGG